MDGIEDVPPGLEICPSARERERSSGDDSGVLERIESAVYDLKLSSDYLRVRITEWRRDWDVGVDL